MKNRIRVLFIMQIILYLMISPNIAKSQNYTFGNNIIFNKSFDNPAYTSLHDTSELKIFFKNKFINPVSDSYNGMFEKPLNGAGIGLSIAYADFYNRYFHTTQVYEKYKQLNAKLFFRKNISQKISVGAYMGFVKNKGFYELNDKPENNTKIITNEFRLDGGIGVIYKINNWIFGSSVKSENVVGYQEKLNRENSIGLSMDYCYHLKLLKIEQLINFNVDFSGVINAGFGNLIYYKKVFLNADYHYKNDFEISIGCNLFQKRIQFSLGYLFQFDKYNKFTNNRPFDNNHFNSSSMCNYRIY